MDHKLRVFKEVALAKSFTRAAKKLHVSQPAVSKTIKTLEEEYGKAFFYREGNRTELTEDGRLFLGYAEKILDLYKDVADEFSKDDTVPLSKMEIGASTTIAYYIIPELVYHLQNEYPDLQINLTTGNTDEIQQLTLKKQLDLAIVEGENHNSRLHYKKFVKDEIVLVTNAENRAFTEDTITLDGLKELPFVEREAGSGTREVIAHALRKHGIGSLPSHSMLGSTESIKSYLYHAEHFAFISIHAVSRDLLENRLRIIDVENLKIERWFYFITRQGYHSNTSGKIENLLLKAYNKK